MVTAMEEITRHYLKRAYERFGLDEIEAEKLVRKALLRGKIQSQMPPRERKYMKSKETAEGCKPVFYQEKIFIFSGDDNCITVYPSPEWFGKKHFYAGKIKIRKVKKYLNLYSYL